jgi:hypothetical protein
VAVALHPNASCRSHSNACVIADVYSSIPGTSGSTLAVTVVSNEGLVAIELGFVERREVAIVQLIEFDRVRGQTQPVDDPGRRSVTRRDAGVTVGRAISPASHASISVKLHKHCCYGLR